MQRLIVFGWLLLGEETAEPALWLNEKAQVAAAEITEEVKDKKGAGNNKQRVTGSKAQVNALFKNSNFATIRGVCVRIRLRFVRGGV